METSPEKQQKQQQNANNTATSPPRPKIDECGRLYIDDFLRIHDPNSQEILLEKRN
jgi:hypothetical protein